MRTVLLVNNAVTQCGGESDMDMDGDLYEQMWWRGYNAGYDLMCALRRSARSSVELRQMAEGVSDLLTSAADDLERMERRAS